MSTELPTPGTTLTPRTDAAVLEKILCANGDEEYTVYPVEELIPAEDARDLECELNEAKAQLATAQEDQKRLREALTPWLDSYKTWMAEAREVGHSDFCVTAGMVVNTMNALRAMQSSPTLAREERIIK